MKKFLVLFMVITLFTVMAIPTLAATSDDLGIPSPNSVISDSPGYTFALITYTDADGQYYLHLFKNTPTATEGSPIPDEYKISASGGYKQYRLSSGAWSFQNESASNFVLNLDNVAFGSSLYGRTYVWSSAPIGGFSALTPEANFFPLPLYFQVQEITTATMVTEIPKLNQAMMTIVLCGVGCLASLIVLSLLGKRSLISR